MFTHETRLKELKHEVLKQVAILAKDDRLTKEELEKVPHKIIQGDVAHYRCCVYKERAIVNERLKLAAGCMPDGDAGKELIDIREDDQIVYVIEAACDRCPINKYTVTEACRGCLAHKCMEVCPANAITQINGRAFINQELCKECGRCKQVCPYNAVSEVLRPCKTVCPTGALDVGAEDRRAVIKNEDCINCGACMSACPFGAISDKSFIVPVAKRLSRKRNMYAVVAPAIAGQFGPNVSVGQIKTALKELGFTDIVEAACGADAVTVHEGNEFVERMERGDNYMTNSCCPAFVSYVEKVFPQEKEKISHTVSPMVATGRYIKEMDKDAKVVFIGPCTAKKNEANNSKVNDAVDYVLTFEEMAALMDAFDIHPSKYEGEAINDASLFGRGFAAGGGLTAAVENYVSDKGLDVEFKSVKASGPSELKKTMTMAKVGRLPGNFVEGMMCEGGCIGGPASIVPLMKTKAILSKFSKESEMKTVLSNEKIKNFEAVELEK